MSSSIPPVPIRVPLTGNTTRDEAASWAATFAGRGELPYDPPKFVKGIATIQMPPHVQTPASEGFQWFPVEAFSRHGLRSHLMRKIAIAVWRSSVWNTWRARYRAYVVASWVAWLAVIALTTPDLTSPSYGVTAEMLQTVFEKLLVAAPTFAFAVLALVATRGIRYITFAKGFAVLAMIFGLLLLGPPALWITRLID